MISPPSKADIFPGRLPPVRQQWGRLSVLFRTLVFVVPQLVVVAVLAANRTAGVTAEVMFVGVGLVSVVFVKNRTDRHNAAIDHGEIAVPAGHNLRAASASDLPGDVAAGILYWGVGADGVGRVARFDGGWLITNRNPRDVAVVAGDDGGWARFDPKRVPDVWAVSEYLAGRGREQGALP